MKRVDVVIGANYGDEGKGLITDYLARKSKESVAVVRFNGGAQAGHTVQLPDGTRHVFSHFGSGSLAGAATILSRFFVTNPILFFKEAYKLNNYINVGELEVYVSPLAPVTTPFDVALNRLIEHHRSNGRHGSCGVGFGETLERSQFAEFDIRVKDLRDTNAMREKLVHIFQHYVPARWEQLTGEQLPVDLLAESWVLNTRSIPNTIIENFIDAAHDFSRFVKKYAEADVLDNFEHIIFEGAQGLQLDQDYGTFPHVTRSNTGLKNVIELVNEANLNDLNVHYLTRAYLTRHGAGPFNEQPNVMSVYSIQDATNVPNPHQGSLRFSYFDAGMYGDAVNEDLWCYLTPHSHLTYQLLGVVTCTDQVQQGVKFYDKNGSVVTGSVHDLIRGIKESIKADEMLISTGPTHNDVRGYHV